MKEYVIRQIINGKQYSYNKFETTEEYYRKIKSLILLPKKNEIITERLTAVKFLMFKDETGLKTYLFNLVLKQGVTSKKIFKTLRGITINGVKEKAIYYLNEYHFYPKNLIKQGKEFEYFVSNYFKNQGYEVINNFEKEEKDEGIDIIAKKGNEELLLIQCKNWEIPVISHKEIKEFLGNCYLFLYNHIEYRKFKKVRRIYITSNSNLDKSAKYLLKDNYPFVEYLQIPFKKEMF